MVPGREQVRFVQAPALGREKLPPDKRSNGRSDGAADQRRDSRGARSGPRQGVYEALGWTGQHPDDEVAFFQAGGTVRALPRDKLVEENGLEEAEGASAVTLGYLVRSPEEADELLAAAKAAGGRVTHPAEEMFWGGCSGTIADPDGHAWEVAHDPGWTLADDGTVTLGA